jgi:ribosomal protein L11 methyltransferase
MVEYVMAWLEIHIDTTIEHADTIGEYLTILGAQAISMHDGSDVATDEPDTDQQLPPLWQKIILVGLFEFEQDISEVREYLQHQQTSGTINRYTTKPIPDEDWERRCLADFKPLRFGKRLWICPSWLTPPDPAAINLIVDPGLAFGTGTHSTTALCLEWLDQNVKAGDTIIDYGCGSGILALAAIKLGAALAIAIDLDTKALAATRDNAKRNKIDENTLKLYLPEEFSGAQADILIANILAGPLKKLAHYLANLVKPGGKIVLSGILNEQFESIIDAYMPWFAMQPPVFKEEWCSLTGVRQ